MNIRIFSLSLNAVLGILSGGIDLAIWRVMGRPDVLVASGWEEFHFGCSVIIGFILGLPYGFILNQIIRLKNAPANLRATGMGTIGVAVCLYTASDIISIKMMNCLVWFIARVLVIILSFALASKYSSKSQMKDIIYSVKTPQC